ncbi:MAG: DUF47 domain-containing protein [Alphaproteobacteria bacterium]
MFMPLFSWFKITRSLDFKIAQFNNNLCEAGSAFKDAVNYYLEEGISTNFNTAFAMVQKYEATNDDLRREIETNLFSYTLIPDSRGDVLTLIESLDKILNKYESILLQISIEKPVIPESYAEYFNDITEAVTNCTESLVKSSKAFFKNITEVKSHIYNVVFLKEESAKTCSIFQKALFENNELELIHKSQIRSLGNSINEITHLAANITDKLTIFTIKRIA